MLKKMCLIAFTLVIAGCTNTSHLSGDVHSSATAGRVQQVFMASWCQSERCKFRRVITVMRLALSPEVSLVV